MWLALEHIVSAKREPHDSPHLLFDVALVAQFGNRHARQRGIDCLPRQGHKFLRVVFIVLGQGEKKFGLDRRALHLIFSTSSVPLRKSSRNGTSVGLRVTLVECTNAARGTPDTHVKQKREVAGAVFHVERSRRLYEPELVAIAGLIGSASQRNMDLPFRRTHCTSARSPTPGPWLKSKCSFHRSTIDCRSQSRWFHRECSERSRSWRWVCQYNLASSRKS